MNVRIASSVAAIALVATLAGCPPSSRRQAQVNDDPCDFAANRIAAKDLNAFQEFSDTLQAAESLDDFLRRGGNVETDRYPLPSIYRIDIDGDGIPDFRIEYATGNACWFDEFRLGLADGTVGETVGGLETEFGCHTSPDFFRLGRRTYAIAGNNEAADLTVLTPGKFETLCRLHVTHPAANLPIVPPCPAPVCAHFAALIPELYTAWRTVPAGRALTAEEKVRWRPRALRPVFETYDGPFFVDIDNDGIDEIYERHRVGDRYFLNFAILKREQTGYRKVDPHKLFRDFDLVVGPDDDFPGVSEDHKDAPNDLNFVKIGAKTYVVKAAGAAEGDDVDYRGVPMDYTLFLIENGRVHEIATAQLERSIRVRIERMSPDD